MLDQSPFTNYKIKFFDQDGAVVKAQTVKGKDESTALTLGRMIVKSTPAYQSCTVFCGNLQTAYTYSKEPA